MKKKLMVLSGLILGLPMVSFAAPSCVSTGDIWYVFCVVGSVLNSVVPVLSALAIVYFVWGVVTYVIASDEEAKKTGRDRIIYGIIGLAVIVAVWGLVSVLVRTFNLNTTPLPPPAVY